MGMPSKRPPQMPAPPPPPPPMPVQQAPAPPPTPPPAMTDPIVHEAAQKSEKLKSVRRASGFRSTILAGGQARGGAGVTSPFGSQTGASTSGGQSTLG